MLCPSVESLVNVCVPPKGRLQMLEGRHVRLCVCMCSRRHLGPEARVPPLRFPTEPAS